MENKKRALGRGLEQLFNNENFDLEALEKSIYETAGNEEIVKIAIEDLRPNPYQPRKTFKDDSLSELAESIKEHGVFQPIIVKKGIKGYEIIAGERRYRASKIAGLEKIPAIIRNFTDEQMIEIALLENIQRENLNAIEEALAYRQMIERLSLTQEELARKVGKSRSHVTNMLGLLNLPAEIQELVAKEKLTMAHARVLSKLESNEQIIDMAGKIIANQLPVHDVEGLVKQEEFKRKHKFERKIGTSEYKYVEDLLRDKLDTRVRIKDKKIEISFANVADLNRILEVLDVKDRT